MTSRPWLPLAAVAVTLLLWSSAFVAIRHLGPTYSPGGLSLGRLLVGSIALGVVVLFRGGHRPARRDGPGLVAIGLLWYGLYNVTLNAGERRVDAGTAAMLIQLSPVLVAALATLFLRERATAWLWVGLVVAFAGVALIGLSTSPGGNHDLLGVLLVLVAATAYAIALIVQKPLMARLPAVEVTWIACTVGMVACLPYAGDLVHDVGASSLADAGWVVYLGLFPTAIAFTTYAYALTHMDASRLSVTTYLVPPLTVLMAWMLLDETPPAVAYVGGVLCLVGGAVARRRPRARSEVDEAVPA
jgi:drug/metabolite transporter (DMT)-like permease